ncbi:MAG: class I SAM-dependent methyltransferase [Acidimicrobiia bacterium]
MATPRTNRSRPATAAPAAPIAAWVADRAPWGDTVRYGPGVADEAKLRLLGQLAGKRVLLLGTGCGQLVTQTAATGAKVIGIEPDEQLLEQARAHCAAGGLNLEMYQRDFAELASIRADTVDLVLSVLELAGVADLSRVFRQVHRVLRQEAPIILSLPHPTRAVAAGATLPLGWQVGEHHGIDHGHTIEDVFTALVRTGFRVDNLLELPDDSSTPFPAVLVLRARRLGARPGG